jgi:hypothetical protein
MKPCPATKAGRASPERPPESRWGSGPKSSGGGAAPGWAALIGAVGGEVAQDLPVNARPGEEGDDALWRTISVSMPAFADMQVQGEMARLSARYRIVFTAVTALSSLCAVLFAFGDSSFVTLWTGGKNRLVAYERLAAGAVADSVDPFVRSQFPGDLDDGERILEVRVFRTSGNVCHFTSACNA